MAMKRKTWSEKLQDTHGLPKVEKITGKKVKKWGEGTIVVPAPMEVNELMSKVPLGKVTTINDIRLVLARKHGASICCPITTGIFAWIAANAAEETSHAGLEPATPYWRTLKSGGVINEKYPGGAESQKLLLEKEGHSVSKKGKNYVVQGFEKQLFSF